MKDHQNEQDIKSLAKRTALLLEVAEIEKDEKDAWLAMLQEMSFDQVNKLITYLELKIPGGANIEFKEFQEQVQELQSSHENVKKTAEEKAMSELDDIEAQLDET